MKMNQCFPLISFSLFLSPIGSFVSAAPTAEESFSTEAGSYDPGDLIGQSAPTTRFNGSWLAAYVGAASPVVISTGLSYSDGTESMATTGGAIEYSSAGRTGQLLNQAYTNLTDGAVYFSVLIKVNSVVPEDRGVEFHEGGFDDGAHRRLQIVTGEPGAGITDSSYVLRLFNDTTNFAIDLGEADTDTNLFVGRIDFSTNPAGDAITIWRNPGDLKVEANSTPAGSLTGFDLRIDRTSFAWFGASDPIQFDELRFGTSWSDVTTVIDPADSDNDGMLDAYEEANGLIVGIDDSAGDIDSDGSSNLEEFTRNTRANIFDTNGDGIRDGWEDGGGTFTNERSTGTNPLNPDTDDDGLLDGVETNTGIFESEDDTGTNPHEADSDDDGESDGVEVREETDPNSDQDSSAIRGLVIIDGKKDAFYGEALAVQTVQIGFGDNGSEWNAVYAHVAGNFLNVLITGNLEGNFNKLELFFDTATGGSEIFNAVTGNDGSEAMNGMTFDPEFTPEFYLIARRGGDKFDLNIANFAEGQFAQYERIFEIDGVGIGEGIGETGTGNLNDTPVRISYDGSNSAGIGGDQGAAADQVAAQAVMTGLEFRIDLSDLDNGDQEMKAMILQNNNDHNFLSNQSLGGLPAGTFNLENPANINFGNIAGDQFFSIPGTGPGTNNNISIILDLKSDPGNSILYSSGLISGRQYHYETSSDLIIWTDRTDSTFTAPGTGMSDISFPSGTDTKLFYRVAPGIEDSDGQ